MAPGFTARKIEFAASLKAARKTKRMSQERAAAAVGTSRRHWIRWESGETTPNPLYLEKIAAVLDAPELLGDDDDEEAAQLPSHHDLLEALRPLAELLATKERVA